MSGHVKSSRVGPATDSDGVRTTAYRAVTPVVCVQCGGAILPDHLFSRRAQRGTRAAIGVLMTVPFCVTCRPLHVEGAPDAPAPTEGDHHER